MNRALCELAWLESQIDMRQVRFESALFIAIVDYLRLLLIANGTPEEDSKGKWSPRSSGRVRAFRLWVRKGPPCSPGSRRIPTHLDPVCFYPILEWGIGV